MKTAGKLSSTAFMVAVASLVATSSGGEALAEGPEAFGPVASRTFQGQPGTTLEKAGKDCKYNIDWLFVRGPNVANAKRITISPRTPTWPPASLPTTECVAPDCAQVSIWATERDAPGPRTVTLTHADGRTLTTTFEIIENAGRCSSPKGK